MVFRCAPGRHTYLPQSLARRKTLLAHLFDVRAQLCCLCVVRHCFQPFRACVDILRGPDLYEVIERTVVATDAELIGQRDCLRGFDSRQRSQGDGGASLSGAAVESGGTGR